jgi:ABC-type transport system substrate-binding protein
VDSYEEGNRIVYNRNPDYFKGPDAVYLEEMEFLIIPTTSTATAAFRSGEIDLLPLANVSCVEASELEGQIGGEVHIKRVTGNSAWFAFNTLKPPFDDVRVRQAIALSYNREAESQAIFCGEAGVNGLIPMAAALDAEDPSTFPESANWLRYAPDEAKKLLAAAGFPDGFATTAAFTPRYGETYQFALERVIGDLKLVGITVEPKSYEYGEWIADIYRGEYKFEGFLWGPGRTYSDADPYVSYWLHPDGIANQSRVNDPVMTALIEKQRTQLDVDERWETLHEIQRLEAENMWYVWRTAGVGTSFAQEWVQDYAPHNNYDSGEYMHIWDSRLS